MTGEAPNSKLQTPRNHQIPSKVAQVSNLRSKSIGKLKTCPTNR